MIPAHAAIYNRVIIQSRKEEEGMQMRALKIRSFNDEIRDYNVDIRIAFGQKNEDICPDESDQPCINWLARAWVSAIKQKERKKEIASRCEPPSLSLSRDDTWYDIFIRLESTYSYYKFEFTKFSIDKILPTERTTWTTCIYIYIYILEALSTVVRYLGSRANRVVRDISFSGSRACNAHVHTGWKCIITLGLFCTVEAHWAAPLLVLFEQFRPIESQPTRNSIAIPANNKARRTRCTRWKGRGRNISKSEKWSPPPLQQIIRDVSRKFSYFVFFFCIFNPSTLFGSLFWTRKDQVYIVLYVSYTRSKETLKACILWWEE